MNSFSNSIHCEEFYGEEMGAFAAEDENFEAWRHELQRDGKNFEAWYAEHHRDIRDEDDEEGPQD